jgi:hypothetical protein
MKILTILCLIGAIASSVASLRLFAPAKKAQLQFYHAHDAVEQIAFGTNGTAELQQAVTDERAAAKDWLIGDGICRIFIWPSVGFSSLALLAAIFIRCKNPSAK